MTKKKYINEIEKLTENDKARLLQCLLCGKKDCNCTEEDEDEKGFCLKSNIRIRRKDDT